MMWKLGMKQWTLTIVLLFGLSSGVRSDDIQVAAELSPTLLREDVESLLLQLETVHPNARAYISQERYAKIQAYLRSQCDGPLTLQEFYGNIKVALDHLEEGHTLVRRPLGKTPDEQKRAAQAQLARAMATGSIHENSYGWARDRNVCILRYNRCGLPRERLQYKALFARMLTEMKANDTQGLIIDLRRNGGGSSRCTDELIRYLARTPFRQYERMAKRLTPQVSAFYKAVGIDYMTLLSEACDMSSLSLDPNGLPAERDFTVEAKWVAPAEESLRFAGPVYVLIGRGTYSSAMLLASTLRHYGLATLIGEETLPFVRSNQHYGDVVLVSLPHSQLMVQISTAVFTVARADREESDRIVPDYKVAPKKSDSSDDVDTAEAFAFDLFEKWCAEQGG